MLERQRRAGRRARVAARGWQEASEGRGSGEAVDGLEPACQAAEHARPSAHLKRARLPWRCRLVGKRWKVACTTYGSCPSLGMGGGVLKWMSACAEGPGGRTAVSWGPECLLREQRVEQVQKKRRAHHRRCAIARCKQPDLAKSWAGHTPLPRPHFHGSRCTNATCPDANSSTGSGCRRSVPLSSSSTRGSSGVAGMRPW